MIVGIDLGTTNSLVAYYTEEGPKIIPNRLGEHLTPSVVSIDEEDKLYIGKTAKERMLLYPDTAASVFKRDMGSDKEFKLGNKTFKAEELSSFVLRSLKEDAEEFLGEEVTEAIISVPAYFNDERRKATKRAGELAGLKVERIISEPTAAAIAYGLYQSKENAKFLVFDLGGGTFDVSILELFENILEVHAVAGDNFLGGEDFTNAIVDLFFDEFKELSKENLSSKELKHIIKQAEKCKIGFEDGRLSKMNCVIQDKEYDFELSIDAYEKACEGLFDRMKDPVKKSLSDAGIKLSDIDKVVLVGGATKLTLVRKFVSRLFRTMPDLNINPDEAVALGAAIQGAMKERKDSIREVILTDVCPFTLGTEVVVQNEAERYEDGHFCPIIERNTIIPASRTERVYTAHDYQSKIRVKVLQGESRYAKNNLLLGELNVDVPKKKAGEVAIDITYTYDINSLLEVELTIVGTDTKITEIIKNQYTKMSEEEIKKRFEELSYLKIHPRDQEENKLLLLRGERLYEENLGEERKIIEHHIMKFEAVLNSHDQKRINKQRDEFKEFLDSYEDFS